MTTKGNLVWVGKTGGHNNEMGAYISSDNNEFWPLCQTDKSFRNLICKLKKQFILRKITYKELIKLANDDDLSIGVAYYIILGKK